MIFVSTLIASFLAFLGAMALMAVGLLLRKQQIRGGCGNPEDCHCGGSQSPDPPNYINESVSR